MRRGIADAGMASATAAVTTLSRLAVGDDGPTSSPKDG
jgi:hypothetical protein